MPKFSNFIVRFAIVSPFTIEGTCFDLELLHKHPFRHKVILAFARTNLFLVETQLMAPFIPSAPSGKPLAPFHKLRRKTKGPDVVIPLVFPDYKIRIHDDLKINFTIPGINYHVKYTFDGKYNGGGLGHAGVLFIEGPTGLTKYYEYGRYDKAQKGEVRKRSIPNVRLGDDGRPTHDSLAAVLHAIAREAGQGGRVLGAYIEAGGQFHTMWLYAQKREAENYDPHRADYTLLANNCMTFAKQVAEAGGKSMPAMINPAPETYINKVRATYPALDYNAKTHELVVRYHRSGLGPPPVPSWAQPD